MLFAIYAYDKADAGQLRAENRPAHLRYLKDAGDRIKLAGPILSTDLDGKPVAPMGSMLVVDAASAAAAKLFVDNDPYRLAGVFDRVEIHPYMAVLGEWAPPRPAQ